MKCSKCGQLNGAHKMGCETRKITIMADITKCTGKGCEFKNKCYRFTAKDSFQMQSYFTIPPIKNGKCDMYWGENSERIFNQLKEIVNGKG